ncbi:hypothetical protein V6N13_129768 [Hibiscus sabdariffa]|uniref:Uncharacterized protein n=1 Tax=Hibiscus sabdariffa TaxID=183260 RepID=A0ABR2SM69_9ROSI
MRNSQPASVGEIVAMKGVLEDQQFMVDQPVLEKGQSSKSVSYAFVVSGDSGKAGNGVGLHGMDDVVVLNEDCVVDNSGSYPSIEFSERVHAMIDETPLLLGPEANLKPKLLNQSPLLKLFAAAADTARAPNEETLAPPTTVVDRRVRPSTATDNSAETNNAIRPMAKRRRFIDVELFSVTKRKRFNF